jgi:hypothetical protein
MMRLSDLCSRFARGDDSLYVTTQPLPEDADGRPTALFASPVAEMASHLPMRPAIMGQLVPSTINAWLGMSREGSSSQLHHDFHDNLYLLVAGRKRFTIASPADTDSLYPHGSVAHVHPNGLINYGCNLTRGDGALPSQVVDYLKSLSRIAHSPKEQADVSAQLRAAQLMARELEAVAAAASSSRAPTLSDDDDGDTTTADDMWAAMASAAAASKGDLKKKRVQKIQIAPGKGAGKVRQRVAPAPVIVDNAVPSHFSHVDLPGIRARAAKAGGHQVHDMRIFQAVQEHAEVRAQWPRFQGVTLTTFDLESGQLLYLPAGWWHEVVSFASARTAPLSAEKVPVKVTRKRSRSVRADTKHLAELSRVPLPEGAHLALNWWFYPPSTDTYQSPYDDGFWEHVFAETAAGASAHTLAK